jgi:hypothetical protein
MKYGLLTDELNKSFLAVPYVAANTPSTTSEFTNPLLVYCFTILSYKYNNDYPLYILKEILNKVKISYTTADKIIQTRIQVNKVPIEELNFDEKKLLMDVLKRQDNLKKITEHMVKKIRYNKQMYNASSADLIYSINIPNRIGFTGTAKNNLFFSNDEPKPLKFTGIPLTDFKSDPTNNSNKIIKEIILRSDVDKKDTSDEIDAKIKIIFDKLAQKKESKKITKVTEEDTQESVEYSINTVIDIGGYLRGISNKYFFEKFFEKFSDEIFKYILYFNNEDMVTCEDRTGKKYNTGVCNRDNTLYFYDNVHITGTDYPIPEYSIGLALLDVGTKYRDIAQGIYRMRKLEKDLHKIKFIVNKLTDEQIVSTTATAQTPQQKLLDWSLGNEKKDDIKSQNLFEVQKQKTIFRKDSAIRSLYKISNVFKLPEREEEAAATDTDDIEPETVHSSTKVVTSQESRQMEESEEQNAILDGQNSMKYPIINYKTFAQYLDLSISQTRKDIAENVYYSNNYLNYVNQNKFGIIVQKKYVLYGNIKKKIIIEKLKPKDNIKKILYDALNQKLASYIELVKTHMTFEYDDSNNNFTLTMNNNSRNELNKILDEMISEEKPRTKDTTATVSKTQVGKAANISRGRNKTSEELAADKQRAKEAYAVKKAAADAEAQKKAEAQQIKRNTILETTSTDYYYEYFFIPLIEAVKITDMLNKTPKSGEGFDFAIYISNSFQLYKSNQDNYQYAEIAIKLLTNSSLTSTDIDNLKNISKKPDTTLISNQLKNYTTFHNDGADIIACMNDPTKSTANIVISNIETYKEYPLILKLLPEIKRTCTTTDSSESMDSSSSDNLFSAQKLPYGIIDNNNNYTSVIQLIYRITELTQFLIINKQQITSHYPTSAKIVQLINILDTMKRETVNKLVFVTLVDTSRKEDPGKFLEDLLQTFDCFTQSPDFKLCYSKTSTSQSSKKLPDIDPRNFFMITLKKTYTKQEIPITINDTTSEIDAVEINTKLTAIQNIEDVKSTIINNNSYTLDSFSINLDTSKDKNTSVPQVIEEKNIILPCIGIMSCLQNQVKHSVNFIEKGSAKYLEFNQEEIEYTFDNYIFIKLQDDNITPIPKNIDIKSKPYELIAMLVNTDSKHYFTFAKYEGTIYKFDNSSVNSSTSVTTEFNNIIENKLRTKPYILLYRKKSDYLFPTPTEVKDKLEEYLEDV